MSAIARDRRAYGNLWELAVSSKVRDLAHRDLLPLGEGMAVCSSASPKFLQLTSAVRSLPNRQLQCPLTTADLAALTGSWRCSTMLVLVVSCGRVVTAHDLRRRAHVRHPDVSLPEAGQLLLLTSVLCASPVSRPKGFLWSARKGSVKLRLCSH